MKLLFVCLYFASSVCVAQTNAPVKKDRRGNALEWIQKSAEYRVAARQAFLLAKLQLDQALQQPAFSADEVQLAAGGFEALSPAVILDVDETVLDNSEYNRRQMAIGAEYDSQSWAAWGKERIAIPVPGAVEFLKYAKSKNVEVFFVTNRKDELHNATFDNLLKIGVSTSLDRILTRNSDEGRGGDKISRRATVAANHRIALLIGDNFADLTARDRDEFKADPQISAGWVMLPNPVYGYWETRPEPTPQPVVSQPTTQHPTTQQLIAPPAIASPIIHSTLEHSCQPAQPPVIFVAPTNECRCCCPKCRR